MNSIADPDVPTLKPPRLRGLRIIAALIIREMGSTYGTSPGGYLWAIISPVGVILILSVSFSFLVKSPALGTSFVLFYATGYLPFDLYNQLSLKIAAALRFCRSLLVYPGLTWMHAVLSRLVLNILTSLMVFFVVTIGIMLFVKTHSVISLNPILIGLSLASLFGFAMGMVNCLLMGLFPVWERIWPVLSRPLFLLSGMLFIYEDMPRFAQNILWWNPVMHAVALVRTGFYPTYHGSFISISYVCAVSLIMLALSMIFLRRFHQRVLEI